MCSTKPGSPALVRHVRAPSAAGALGGRGSSQLASAGRGHRAHIGEGFDSPALDTLSLAAPIAFKAVSSSTRPYPAALPGKATAEIHDYHNLRTGVLATSLAKRAPGYTSLGFPDPRRSSYTTSSGKTGEITQSAE